MTTPAKMKEGDLLPALEYDVRYRDRREPLAIPLDTTVVFTMRLKGSTGTPKVNREAAAVVSSAGGTVRLRYQWQTGDTDTAGNYEAEFELDIGGSPMTVPTVGYIPVVVGADLS